MTKLLPERAASQDFDNSDDDDEQNTPQKVAPTLSQLNSPESDELSKSQTPMHDDGFDAKKLIKDDLVKYVQTLIPKDHPELIQCLLKREQEGLTKIFSLYFLGQDPNEQILLLTARKHLTVGGHSEFFIGVNVDHPSKSLNEQNCIAKLRSTKLIGHEYVLQDYQKPLTNESSKPQTLAVVYEEHTFGSSDPRQMTVVLRNTAAAIRPMKDNETILDEWRAGLFDDFLEFRNKSPTLNEESKRYTMQFLHDRVRQPSHKNFQLVNSNEQQEESIFLQFGRIDENTFALDYRYPLAAIEAFAIGLSSFHKRFRP